jgi:WD40 repeat protein
MVSGSGDNTIHTWDVQRGITTTSPLSGYQLEGGVRSIALSPDGSQIAAGLDNETLRLLDARSGVMIGKPYSGHTSFVLSVAFSPDGTYIASGSDDQTVRIWDIRTGGQVGEPFYEHTSDVWSVSYSPCGTRVASGSYDGKVIVRHVPGNSVHPEPVCEDFLEDKSGLSIVESLAFDQSNSASTIRFV